MMWDLKKIFVLETTLILLLIFQKESSIIYSLSRQQKQHNPNSTHKFSKEVSLSTTSFAKVSQVLNSEEGLTKISTNAIHDMSNIKND